jgi:hypothetical protein
MKVEYDPKCAELAQWFLDDAYGTEYDESLLNTLAGVIQTAIEGWFEDREAAPNRPGPRRSFGPED